MAHGYGCNYLFVVESEKRLFRVTTVSSKIIPLSSENLGSVDHTAPVYRIVTSIVDFDTHSRLSLGLLLLLKTAISGEEHMRNNVYN